MKNTINALKKLGACKEALKWLETLPEDTTIQSARALGVEGDGGNAVPMRFNGELQLACPTCGAQMPKRYDS